MTVMAPRFTQPPRLALRSRIDCERGVFAKPGSARSTSPRPTRSRPPTRNQLYHLWYIAESVPSAKQSTLPGAHELTPTPEESTPPRSSSALHPPRRPRARTDARGQHSAEVLLAAP